MNQQIESTAALSAPSGADYFSVFALPHRLKLDQKALERAFYRRSREVHPDRFTQASPEKQQWSLEQTSMLNDAYRTLRDPITRTEYLLRLEGVSLAEDVRAADTQAKKNIPPELLAEVFELNMQLEEMRTNTQMGEDDPQLRADLEQARSGFEAQMESIATQLDALWSAWDAALEAGDLPAQKASTAAMAALLDRRRYIRNLVRDVHTALGGSLGS